MLTPIAIGILLTASVFAQTPQKMSYQAVIRDNSDALVTNTQVGIQISILQGSANGTVIYTETQTPTTNNNGLVSIEIGGGNDFSTIDWANDIYFIKTETDLAGGVNYTITGTSQLLSVPYALHAKTAETVSAEADPLWATSPSFGITNTNITNWSTAYDWGNHATAGYITSYTETDPSVPVGTTPGEMQYWDGSAWVIVAVPTNSEGATLQMINGVPTWTGGAVPIPSVTNPITGRIWMDRNLGASQVATSSDDALAYGDLYQWGRGTDGHQIRTSATTTTLSSTDDPGHGDFILAVNPMGPRDWRNPQNNDLWQGVNGINNPCPSGYRLPTQSEWDDELNSWDSQDAAGAFASPLKLTVAGQRTHVGALINVGTQGFYWSSTISSAISYYLFFSSSNANTTTVFRAAGLSVRCIKE